MNSIITINRDRLHNHWKPREFIPMFPELTKRGPNILDLNCLKFYFDEGSRFPDIQGCQFLQFLEQGDILKQCLGLPEGDEIAFNEGKIPKSWTGRKRVHLWKSVSWNNSSKSGILVPYLVITDMEWGWEIKWEWLHHPDQFTPPVPYYNLILMPRELSMLNQ